jgi:outer membrane protein assembly factor BamD (BamD/ComL family)
MAGGQYRQLKVFLCHASGDKPPVRELYKRLTAEGVDAWLDQEKLLPGQDWRMEIPRAVREADVVVICLSKSSITKEGYVQKEIKFALDIAEEKPEGTIFLIPARLEDCVVPERLNRWQWVDLYEDNGFIKLLRSLKLRANAVGVTIEPASYVDSDEERKRRMEQLYTEGLAAFYTEDWDKACQRFQAILSEQPNHKNAAEKLTEAEHRRNLARLYEQATKAVQSEVWVDAIQILEELSQISPDYKNTSHLLKNARKQKQLKELYIEARALHTAQKWEAVVKVFEQISSIDPDFPDPDELLPSAQKEVHELEQLAELNDQYSQALREMDTGNWYEARRLLELVHKSQTGFLETEKLLKKVENEIAKEEEKRKQNDQINTLYEQAHGLLRSKKWRNALEKLEQIQKLDDHFPDADGIAEKAQKEIAREEQEAERQNKLAALYAEAVKLLKGENYHEALDKWEEVKAIDPKYPDRQRVQSIARKELNKSAKLLQNKPRYLSMMPIWIGTISFIVIGVVLAGVSLSDGGRREGLSSPTSMLSENNLVISTATNVPIMVFPDQPQTAHPSQTTPTAGGYSDPTMYDAFDNPIYDESFNTTLWNEAGDVASGKIIQENDLLTLEVSGGQQIIALDSKQTRNPTYPRFIEGKIMLEPTQGRGADIGIGFRTAEGYSVCSIYTGITGTDSQDITCWSWYFGIKQRNHNVFGITPGSWHLLRVELYPETMTFDYLVDGNKIGSYIPREHQELADLNYYFSIHINTGDGLGDLENATLFARGHVEYVRTGEIEDSATK